MTIKAIVLDMDGTLLTSKKDISQRTHDALIKAQEKGIKVILASGRPTQGMVQFAKSLKMDEHHGLIVSHNGARVIDVSTNELIYDKSLSVAEAKDILKHLSQFNVIPMVEKEERMYVNDVFSGMINTSQGPINIIEYESRGGGYLLSEARELASIVDHNLPKILVAAEKQYYDKHIEDIFTPFKGKVNGMFSAEFYFEFTALGVDKAKTLNTVLHKYNIVPSELIAFGDGENDLSLIEYAGIGVAMGNAVDIVKQAADDITRSNDEDGIADSLEKYLN